MALSVSSVESTSKFIRFCNCDFGKHTRLIKYTILISIIIILLIGIIVLATRKPTEVTSSPSTSNECKSAECYSYATQLAASIDSSVDPCDNFYDYACGLWLKNTHVDDTEMWNNALATAGTKTNRNLRDILETPTTNCLLPKCKAQDAYKACMFFNLTESGHKFTKILSDKINGWPLAVGEEWSNTNNISSFESLLDVIAEFRHFYQDGFLFSLRGMNDIRNTSNYMLTIYPPGLTWPPRNIAERKSFVDGIVRHAKAANSSEYFDEAFANTSVLKALDLAETVDNIILSTFKRQFESYTKLSISDFQNKTNITWLGFFNKVLEDHLTLRENDEIAVMNLDYFVKLSELIEKPDFSLYSVVDNEVISAITLIDWFQSTSSKSEFYESVVPIFTNPRYSPRWLRCVNMVTSWFKNALAHEYVKKYYDYKRDEVQIRDMVDSMFEIFNARLPRLDWLPSDDKKASKLKLDHMKRRYFYSDWVKNADNVEKYYEEFKIDGDAVSNFFSMRRFMTINNLKRFSSKTNATDEWPKDPLQSNAYYGPQENSIFINAAILQPPVFGSDRLKAMNYGSLGVIIGHEITHGFDPSGTRFDYLGNFRAWLSEEGEDNFNRSSQCFIEQYGRFQLTPDDLPTLQNNFSINGKKTLGENIADNGGLQQAFGAYKRWVGKHGSEKIPDVLQKYTAEQIFFISFSQQWCTKYSYSTILEYDETTGVHSPPKFRVLGSLSNFEEFSKAFNCKPRDVMNPETKCTLW